MKPEAFLLTYAIFSTKDFASGVGVRMDSAARKLKSYEETGIIKKITRGVWANDKHRDFSRYGLVPFLLGAEQGYVSFLSALHRHEVISQVPQKIIVATTGHTRRLRSPVAEFDFIQMNPQYMREGIEWFQTKVSYGMASPEKALLDCLYISTRKGRRFLNFPELELENLNKKKFEQLLKVHAFPWPIEKKIKEKFKELLARG